MTNEAIRGKAPERQERTDSKTASVEEIAADLTKFQEQCLVAIATHSELTDENPHGLAIKERLEVFYGTQVHHGRLYPNLDDLVEHDLVEKSERDRRTNEYELTNDGYELLEHRLERLQVALGNGGEA